MNGDEADESPHQPNSGEDIACQDETAPPRDEQRDSPSVEELLLHNLALRRNFEQLKELHLDLTQANLQLRKTCAKLQAEKCKHLEMDLQKACSVGEEAHEQLVTITYEKDAVISELEQVIYKLQADICTLEEKQENDQKAWEAERQKLQASFNKKERQVNQLQAMHQEGHHKQRQLCKSMEAEIADLHAMIRALEQMNSDVEVRHAEAMKTALKDSETLGEELRKLRNEHKVTTESLHETQVHLAEFQIDAERLRSELQTTHSENSRYQKDVTEHKKANDKLQHKLEKMNERVDDIMKLWEKDKRDHTHQLQELQSRWAAEKDSLVQKEVDVFKGKMDKLCRKSCSLKKKLKRSRKLLSIMTSDYNQLMVRLRECETQLLQAHKVSIVLPYISQQYFSDSHSLQNIDESGGEI